MDSFSNFLLLVMCVNKYHGAVLKVLVYQVHLCNLAKTASELGFQILFFLFGVPLGAISAHWITDLNKKKLP